ncbi:hypothetical protein [Paracidovorax oryzae]|uniref:hypothetical protein n=1 Tax=Paracidovorax oryzae TaxID=862720 RepID=UPI0035D120DE
MNETPKDVTAQTPCAEKKAAFTDKLAGIQKELQDELAVITEDTERRAKEIADDFDAEHDLAEGVGAVAGTAIGGFFGGVAGGAIGGSIGKQIGSLFTMEVGMRRETVLLDVPQTTMKRQDISFDFPEVEMRDTDISFDIPTIEMRRQEGPPRPESRTEMVTECREFPWPIGRVCMDLPHTTVTWVPTYLDIPTVVMRTERIVIGVPTVVVRRQDMSLDLPEIAMKTIEFSFDVPFVTLRFITDAGKRTAALAAALAQSTQDAIVQKQLALKARIQSEGAPLMTAMFGCYRDVLVSARDQALHVFEPQINTLKTNLASLIAKGVPETDDDYVSAKQKLDEAVAALRKVSDEWTQRLADHDKMVKDSLEKFLAGDGKAKTKARIGLLSQPPAAGQATKDSIALQLNKITGLIYFRV